MNIRQLSNVRGFKGSMVGLLLVGLLGGAVGWLSVVIQDTRRDIEEEKLANESLLERSSKVAALSNDLNDKQEEIRLLESYVPDESGIIDVVARFEEEARQGGVNLSIPVVEEVRSETEEEENAWLRRIRMRMRVEGPPEAVLRFFHAVEHLPYLLWVDRWEFASEETTAARGLVGSVPLSGLEEEAEAVGPTGSLSLDVILAVLSNKEGSDEN